MKTWRELRDRLNEAADHQLDDEIVICVNGGNPHIEREQFDLDVTHGELFLDFYWSGPPEPEPDED